MTQLPRRPSYLTGFKQGKSEKARARPITDALIRYANEHPEDVELVAKRLWDDWKSKSSTRRARTLFEGLVRMEGKIPDEVHGEIEHKVKVLVLRADEPVVSSIPELTREQLRELDQIASELPGHLDGMEL